MAGVNSRFAAVREEDILQMCTGMCCVTKFVYVYTIIFFNLGEEHLDFGIFFSMLGMLANILPLFTSISENNL